MISKLLTYIILMDWLFSSVITPLDIRAPLISSIPIKRPKIDSKSYSLSFQNPPSLSSRTGHPPKSANSFKRGVAALASIVSAKVNPSKKELHSQVCLPYAPSKIYFEGLYSLTSYFSHHILHILFPSLTAHANSLLRLSPGGILTGWWCTEMLNGLRVLFRHCWYIDRWVSV